jgi:hypothetical protein
MNPWEMGWGTSSADKVRPPAKPMTPGSWNDINAAYAADKPARDVEQLSILQNERADETNPQRVAMLDREIARVPQTAGQPAAEARMPWEMDWRQPTAAPANASGPGGAPAPLTRTDKVPHGMIHPVAGASQLITKVWPDAGNNAMAAATNWTSGKTGGILPRMPEGGIGKEITQREQAYEQGTHGQC